MKSIHHASISLRPVMEDDAEFILSLRLNPDLNRYLSQVPNDINSQKMWIREYKQREISGIEWYFIITLSSGEDLGTVRLYDFIQDSFCWGSWVMKRSKPPHAAIDTAIAIYDFAFDDLGFIRSHFDVRKENVNVVRFHERLGARITRKDEENFYFEYLKDDYTNIRPKYTHVPTTVHW